MSILTAPSDIASNVTDPIAARIQNPFQKRVVNKDRPQDFPGGFQIIEYVDGSPQDGTNGKPDTRIILAGNMLPMQPFSWDGEQRLNKEYYPGNPEPAVQVLGGKEGDLLIHGRFKDKRLKDPDLYGAAYQYAEAVDAMRKRGNLVKFGMHGQAGDWIRYGFIEKSGFKMNKQSWIDYDISFLVVSDKQPKNNYFVEQDKNTPQAANQDLINKVAAFQQKYSAIPTSMPQSIGDVLNGLISDVATNINLVTNFVNTILTVGEDIAKSANRALGLIKNARTSIYHFQQRADNLKHSFTGLSANNSIPPNVQTTNAYINIAQILGTIVTVSTMQVSLARMRTQFEAISKTLPLARHRVVQGETLQKVSIKHYGVPDNWKVIYDHNQLQTVQLTQGQLLEIPKV